MGYVSPHVNDDVYCHKRTPLERGVAPKIKGGLTGRCLTEEATRPPC